MAAVANESSSSRDIVTGNGGDVLVLMKLGDKSILGYEETYTVRSLSHFGSYNFNLVWLNEMHGLNNVVSEAWWLQAVYGMIK